MVSIPLLEFKDIAFERDDYPLFGGVSASLSPGDIVQVSGPNGCGKTTLLHILATLKPPSDGSILWRGNDIRSNKTRYLTDMAFIGHQAGLKLVLTARENLIWYCQLHDMSECIDSIDAALDIMGLGHCRHIPCGALSAGQLRRVALAILHLRSVALWLLDEPLTALDGAGVGELELLFKSHLEHGGMIIFSSHQPLSVAGVSNLLLGEHLASVH